MHRVGVLPPEDLRTFTCGRVAAGRTRGRGPVDASRQEPRTTRRRRGTSSPRFRRRRRPSRAADSPAPPARGEQRRPILPSRGAPRPRTPRHRALRVRSRRRAWRPTWGCGRRCPGAQPVTMVTPAREAERLSLRPPLPSLRATRWSPPCRSATPTATRGRCPRRPTCLIRGPAMPGRGQRHDGPAARGLRDDPVEAPATRWCCSGTPG